MSEGPDQLSSSDMSSLLNEQGAIHVHVGGTAFFDGDPPPFDEFLAHVEHRLELIPRFRRRVRWLPGRIMRAEWEDDPDFDIRRHVRHVAVPAPGGDGELRELVGQVMSEPLDQRPAAVAAVSDRAVWDGARTTVSRRSPRRTTRSSTGSRRSMWARSSSTRTPTGPTSG